MSFALSLFAFVVSAISTVATFGSASPSLLAAGMAFAGLTMGAVGSIEEGVKNTQNGQWSDWQWKSEDTLSNVMNIVGVSLDVASVASLAISSTARIAGGAKYTRTGTSRNYKWSAMGGKTNARTADIETKLAIDGNQVSKDVDRAWTKSGKNVVTGTKARGTEEQIATYVDSLNFNQRIIANQGSAYDIAVLQQGIFRANEATAKIDIEHLGSMTKTYSKNLDSITHNVYNKIEVKQTISGNKLQFKAKLIYEGNDKFTDSLETLVDKFNSGVSNNEIMGF